MSILGCGPNIDKNQIYGLIFCLLSDQINENIVLFK